MAVATYAAYRALKPYASSTLAKNHLTTVAGRMFDRWVNAPNNGANPTVPVVPTSTTLGALPNTPAGISMWLKKARSMKGPGQVLTVFDRLSHMGGLSGIVAGTITTNLPTAALTRYASGVDVMMAISIYASIGTTATTLSVSYTNSAGTAARTSPPITFGGSADRTTGNFLPIPLQVGDLGVRSVESVTLAATTGAAGAYGITLWKPILSIPTSDLCAGQEFDVVRDLGAFFNGIQPDACLSVLFSAATTAAMAASGSFDLVKQV